MARWAVAALLAVVSAAWADTAARQVYYRLPDEPTPVERCAAGLLAERFSQLTGAEVIEATGWAGGRPSLVITLQRVTEDTHGELETESVPVQPESYRVFREGRSLVIAGADERGMLYGVTAFLEWLIAWSSPIDYACVDIDFDVERGIAAGFLDERPDVSLSGAPFFPDRRFLLSNLALGVGDLVAPDRDIEKYNLYSEIKTGYAGSADTWRAWSDWLARHRCNGISNWPYSAGTNWWELVHDPALAGMSIWSADEIRRAYEVRRSLIEYAASRGQAPYLMNYIPGATTPQIQRERPELVGVPRGGPPPFCLSSEATRGVFVTAAKRIMADYPDLAGLHIRWWGESFPCHCEGCMGNHRRLMRSLTTDVIAAVMASRPDARVLLSGFHQQGDADYARVLPSRVTLQTKWRRDWEPDADPDVGFAEIANFRIPLIISQALPAEEAQELGAVQYTTLVRGMDLYARNRSSMPNFSGFSVVCGERDFGFVTELNYLVAAKVNWYGPSFDADAFALAYLSNRFGPDAAEPLLSALQLQSEMLAVWSEDFCSTVRYIDCYRIHNCFGTSWLAARSPSDLSRSRECLRRLLSMAEAAAGSVEGAGDAVKPGSELAYRHLVFLTRAWRDYFASRLALVDAMSARLDQDAGCYRSSLREVLSRTSAALDAAESMPDISDYFEMEGMAEPVRLRAAVRREAMEIEGLLRPEVIEEISRRKRLFGEPSDLVVEGDVGTTGTSVISIPKLPPLHGATCTLTVSVRDVDGEAAGEEARLTVNDMAFDVPPTGDGRHATFDFDLDPALLIEGDNVVIYRLVGKPGGTLGFQVFGTLVSIEGVSGESK